MGRSTNVHFTIPKQVQRSATSFNVLGEWRGGGDTSIPLCKAGEIFDSQYGFKVAPFLIPLHDRIASIQNKLQELIYIHDCLIIISYVGHGRLNLDMQDHLYPHR
jgi:hypothetical protein